MARSKASIDESQLTKGQIRKLTALRRSLGDQQIADEAFAKWLARAAHSTGTAPSDRTAEKIAAAVQQLRDKEKISIPRDGYVVKSGRGRIIVEPAAKG